MKKSISILVLALTMIAAGCSNTLLDRLPEKVAEFIEEYFPGEGGSVAEFNDDATFVVRLHNSALISFNKEYNWQSVNGFGSTLPQMFLFDQLPPALYQYLQEIEGVNGVYGVVRDTRQYRVELKNQSLLYNIEDGSITTPPSTSQIKNLINEVR